MLDILPADRTWSQDHEVLAQSLADGIDPSDREQLAALSMLMRQGPEVWAQPTFTAHYGRCYLTSAPDSARSINWQQLAFAVAHLNTLPADTRAAVRLACSLVEERVVCSLGDCFAALSPTNRARFHDMMRYAAGVAS